MALASAALLGCGESSSGITSRQSTNVQQPNKKRQTAKAAPQSSGSSAQRGERYAILVGVRNYVKSSGLRPLKYTENDATALAELLQESGYRAENIVLMTDTMGKDKPHRLPERGKIWRELNSMLRDLEAGDSVLVAFAGHGVQFKGDDDSYFCPLDSRIDDRDTLVSMGELYNALKDCRAGFKLLLCDACRNDPISNTTRGVKLLNQQQKLQTPPGGVAVFYSCSEGEFAYEDAELEHGVFFNFILDGLRGAADFDGDLKITLPELEHHTKKRVSDYVRAEMGGSRQMPNLKGNTRGLHTLVVRKASQSLRPTKKPGEIFVFSGHSARVTDFAISADGRRMLSGDANKLLILWDVRTGEKLKELSGHTTAIRSVAISSDGRRALSAGSAERIRYWDLESGRVIHKFDDHGDFVGAVAFSPDDKRMASVGSDAMLRVWALQTHTLLYKFRANYSWLRDVAFSADGRRIITCGNDAHADVWDPETGNRIAHLGVHGAPVGNAVFSPDGKYALTGSFDNLVQIWDISTGKEVRSFIGHAGSISGVAFTPDGSHVLSCAADGTACVWKAWEGERYKNEKPAFTFLGHGRPIGAISCSPDGRYAMTCGDDGKIRLWRMPLQVDKKVPDFLAKD